MLPQWIIEKKRDGHELSAEEIRFMIAGYVRGAIPDYQMAALTMAVTLRGMALEETVALTRAMAQSGTIVDLTSILQPKIDKHSTGGIGDKISLVLTPLAACCGITMPMVAGRGLGITGGTIDKLEAIPGYDTRLDESRFIDILHACGASIIGQTDRLAPADKKLYALRDVTGTVPSIPLIAASILSKKVAAGIEGLVLDVKWGSGALMKSRADAEALAQMLIDVGRRLNLRMAALLTDMNQPLGRAVGNALEVAESVECLRGRGPADIVTVTLELGARMLIMGAVARDREEALALLRQKWQSGEAWERFRTMVRLHGGDTRVLDDVSLLPAASIREQFRAERSGYVQAVAAEHIGKASLILGAGRTQVTNPVDPAAGIVGLKKIGEHVVKDEPLAVLHTNQREALEKALPLAAAAFQIGDHAVVPPPLICKEW